MGPKVRLKPTSMIQKCQLPSRSLRKWPHTLGHQK